MPTTSVWFTKKNIKGPGNFSTETYWDLLRDVDFGDQSLLLMDNLRSHHSLQMTEDMKSAGVKVLYFPSHGGALLNPCDNSFHAELKARYFRKDRNDHGSMLDAIREAIFETKEESILHYWSHCGFCCSEDPRQVVQRLIAEGYAPNSDSYHSEHTEMGLQYDVWIANRRALRYSNTINRKPESLGFNTLDGVYWTVWNSSHAE